MGRSVTTRGEVGTFAKTAGSDGVRGSVALLEFRWKVHASRSGSRVSDIQALCAILHDFMGTSSRDAGSDSGTTVAGDSGTLFTDEPYRAYADVSQIPDENASDWDSSAPV